MRCMFCDRTHETTNHILLNCTMTKQVLALINVSIPSSVAGYFDTHRNDFTLNSIRALVGPLV